MCRRRKGRHENSSRDGDLPLSPSVGLGKWLFQSKYMVIQLVSGDSFPHSWLIQQAGVSFSILFFPNNYEYKMELIKVFMLNKFTLIEKNEICSFTYIVV